ncbi:DUF7426 family protein [Microbacterium trichothecenolyticum]
MSAVDFTEWAAPDLVFRNLGADAEGRGGRTFSVRPPSVGDSAKVLALAARGEVNLGVVPKGTQLPAEMLEVIESIGPDAHPALGATFYEMRDAGISAATIDRAAYYAIFYWARGKEYADNLATLLWAEREPVADAPAGGGDARPKG